MDEISKEVSTLLKKQYPIAIIMGGLPGSGKSTLTSMFVNKGFQVVSKDAIRYDLAKIKYGYKPESLFNDILEEFSMYVGVISNCLITAYKCKLKEESYDVALTAISNSIHSFYKNAKNADMNVEPYVLAKVEAIYKSKIMKGIVFDATHFTVKQRSRVIHTLNNALPVYAVFIDITADEAIERVKHRSSTVVSQFEGKPVVGRSVPSEVIRSMERLTVLPRKSEGFEDVIILNPTIEKETNVYQYMQVNKKNLRFIINNNEKYKKLFPFLYACKNFKQDNKNHKYDLETHMVTFAEVCNPKNCAQFYAALFHDLGKMETKNFYYNLIDAVHTNDKTVNAGRKIEVKNIDTEGNVTFSCIQGSCKDLFVTTQDNVIKDENAHYYNHHNVSALKARREVARMGFEKSIVEKTYDYVLYHMDIPFHTIITKKHVHRLHEKFTYEDILFLLEMRRADIISSGNYTTDDLIVVEKDLAVIKLLIN